MSMSVSVNVNILHPWNRATSQRLQTSHIDDSFGKVLISISRMPIFTKLFQKHSYFLGVFFIANDKFKLKALRVFNFYPKGQQISDQRTDSFLKTTLFSWRCNAAALLKLPSCHDRNTSPAALEHGCSVPPPANSSSGHKPRGWASIGLKHPSEPHPAQAGSQNPSQWHCLSPLQQHCHSSCPCLIYQWWQGQGNATYGVFIHKQLPSTHD